MHFCLENSERLLQLLLKLFTGAAAAATVANGFQRLCDAQLTPRSWWVPQFNFVVVFLYNNVINGAP